MRSDTLAERLHEFLADLVDAMRGFLQISPTNINVKFTSRDGFLQGVNTFHSLLLRASQIWERIRNDTIAKCLEYMFI